MQRYSLRSLVLGLMIAASPAMGGELDTAAVEQRVQEMVERLDLSDEQIVLMLPIVQESMARQQEVLESYGIDPDALGTAGQSFDMRKAMVMRKDILIVREHTRDAAAEVLTETQMQEFLVMQEERAAATREKILARLQR